jgi:hypothetical protein
MFFCGVLRGADRRLVLGEPVHGWYLFAGHLALLGIAAFIYSFSTSYWMLATRRVAGARRHFHDVTLNRRISAHRQPCDVHEHQQLGWALA